MMRRLLFLVAVTTAMLVATPAFAGTLSGGCTVEAESVADSTDVVDATKADPFVVDLDGTLSWDATSPEAIEDHTWEVGIVVAELPITVASGGDPNTAGTTVSEGTRDIPDLLASKDNTQAAWAFENLAGIYEVFGSIAGTGGACSGTAYVLLDRPALSGLAGQASLGAMIVGAAMVVGAGVAKRPRA